jgi:oxygen-independent coproporphyrinogen-3 oxidase
LAGIYIHIPFCKTRCSYCDFFTGTDISLKENLIRAICSELSIRKSYLKNEFIQTIYLGGGTPSLLSKDDFEKIFSTIHSNFSLAQCQEITIEANPDDLTEEYIDMLRTFPFNRISIGIQSFCDKELQFICRRHTAQQAIDAVKNCQKAGFTNISIDLIYGLPEQKLLTWKKNLQQAIDLNIQHLSAYHLTYEKGTLLYQQKKENKILAIDENLSNTMFIALVEKLEKVGLKQYEISNFSLKSYESKHNSSYWDGKKYLGIGPSAHSFDGVSRQWNVASLDKYINNVTTQTQIEEIEVLSEEQQKNEFIITRLRTIKGIDIHEFSLLFGSLAANNLIKQANKYLKTNLLDLTNNTLKLTRKGIFLSDNIICDLLFTE